MPRVRAVTAALLTAALLALGLSWGAADAAARCHSYSPAVVTLTGTLVSRTVPGPPGYRNIARGDYPETIFVLRLDEPICVRGDPLSRRRSHAAIEEVQLVTVGPRARLFRDKPVRVTGSLSGAHTGAHRTPVLLSVKGLRAG